MSKKSRKKGPSLYDLFHRDPLAGGGISKNDTLERNFKNFFKLSWWHIGHILSVNMFFIFGNFPLFFGLLAFSVRSRLAVLPMQDVLFYGGDYRINEPGTVKPQNWAVRFKKQDFTEKSAKFLKELAARYNRV